MRDVLDRRLDRGHGDETIHPRDVIPKLPPQINFRRCSVHRFFLKSSRNFHEAWPIKLGAEHLNIAEPKAFVKARDYFISYYRLIINTFSSLEDRWEVPGYVFGVIT